MENAVWVGLTPILRWFTVSFSLVNREPLRIGAGRGGDRLGSPVDLPVYRQLVYHGDGTVTEEPVIPGSSLKGVLRTATMALLSSCGVEAHSGVGSENCVASCFGVVSVFDQLRRSASAGEIRRLIAGFCPACLLYGAPSLASRVSVGEFTPTEKGVRTGVKTGVGIDRRRGAAAQRVLYTVEYVEPGTVFQGSISTVNTPNWMLSLLAASITAIGGGWFKIGGFKSRGMGLVEIGRGSVEIRVEPVEKRDGSAVLPVLDSGLDREEPLEGCSLEACLRGFRAVCGGEAGYRVLQTLAEAWHSHYCGRAAEALKRRREESSSLCEQYRIASEQ